MKKIIFATVFFFASLMVSHKLFKEQDVAKYIREAEYETELEEEEEEEKKTDQPDKFLQFHRGIRTRDGETSPDYPDGYKWKELQLSRSQSARKRNAQGRTQSTGVLEWTERGPGNVPGRTRALLNIPGDLANNTWLAGSATGGIWRTSDGGASWSERSADFPAMPISCFGADANGSVIYAGTGEHTSSIYSAAGNGIFKSTNRGLSWTQLPSTNNNPEFSIVTRLIVNPSNANIIVATTVPHNLSTDNTSSIMRSADGGVSWTKVKEVTGILEQIIATPGNFNIQYVSQNSVGVWKSTDAGLTWNLSNTGMVPSGRVEIGVSPVNASKVFASAEGSLSGAQSDLYYSSNAGATWSLVDVKFNNTTVDFLEGQGFYDNTIMCDPFDEGKVYFGGVSLFRSTLTSGSIDVDQYKIKEMGTQPFLLLQSFANIVHDNARLTVGGFANNTTVEVRFGPGKTQKAHRFTVPTGATSGVAAANYTYQNYVNIPLEVWDITNNRQLMVSFRDQNQNGKFDLVPRALNPDSDPPLTHSREYFFINDVTYNSAAPNPNIATAGGHEHRLMYNFFPALASGATWDENNLPVSKLVIKNEPISKLNATTVTVTDGRGSFDSKNKSDQIDLSAGVHPDHHFMIPIIVNDALKTYRILIGNDGGIFVSKVSDNPGITNNDWQFKGTGYNTSQFYGADKKPGADVYIGGMQDNGTRFSPASESASALSNYIYGLGGDGFEVIWNSKDPSKILGSVYNGQISRSTNGGITWQAATTGFTPGSTEFSFVTKLANSKDFPDRVFTVGTQGVYVSSDFGSNWKLTPIADKFVISSPLYLDVEVSRANADIVWAGSGMNNTGTLRNLHVSTDGGKTFAATNNFTTVPLGNITKLASHPTQQNTAYALFSFFNAPKILRTTNLGQTWQDISGFGSGTSSVNGFPDVAVYCLYVRPDNPNIIWVGTEIGIVESKDNGQTWALLDDFPNVSVWDMKGQDDQVVIATHGRGIWTALINQTQNVINTPEVIASGTSPQKQLMLRIQSPGTFDSLQVFAGNALFESISNIPPGTFDVALENVPTGQRDIKLVSFRGSAPYQSALYKAQHIDILAVKNSYSTYFDVIADLGLQGLTVQNLSGPSTQRKSLQSDHEYATNKTYQLTIRTPVIVSSTPSTLFYRDIAIIEPEADSVVVEATINGLDWIELTPSYDATFAAAQGKWNTAYNNTQPGTTSMFVAHEIDIKSKFAAGDVLLFRFRMISGPEITSWGWALDYVTIQVPPVAIAPVYSVSEFSVYPNPAVNQFTVDYSLTRASDVSFQIVDMFGRTIVLKQAGLKNPGNHSESLSLDHSSGSYLVIINTSEGRKTTKISIVK